MKTTIKILLTFTLAAVIFSACENEESSADVLQKNQSVAAQNEIKQITVEQANKAIKENNVQFIDVRTPEEYSDGHAIQAINFPLDQLETSSTKLDKDKPVYVICQTGRRSQKGSEILQKAGFKTIYNINGGTGEWIKAGLPTEK